MIQEASLGWVYLACGATDLRKSIDGLAVLVKEGFELDPFSSENHNGKVTTISKRQLRWLLDGLPIGYRQGHPEVLARTIL